MEKNKNAGYKFLTVLLSIVLSIAVLASTAALLRASALTTVDSCKGVTVTWTGSEWATYKNNKRVIYNGVAQNENGWFYCNEKGVVDFKYNGLARNDYGWWYIEKGHVEYSMNGLYSTDYGTYVIDHGRVNFNYNGTYKYNGKSYNIVDGKVTVPPTTTKPAATTTKPATSTQTAAKPAQKIVTDISRWNGDVNFTTMKNSGVSGMMLRAAYGTSEDIYFDAYGAACEREGILYGVYQFATWHYGTTKADAKVKAKQQADALISILKTRKISGFVALDLELESGATLKMTPAELTEVANYYMGLIKAAGYKPMLYCSVSWFFERMVPESISVPLWLAYYYSTGSNAFPTNRYGQYMEKVKSQIKLWQYTASASGSKYGCSSQYVDVSYLYGSFTG